ncbi:hypothetical protein TNCV_1210911 [Trichonephila clavipes]|nr:hypothetical protein TNCV_1210911 [Trichonephila clavipes]
MTDLAQIRRRPTPEPSFPNYHTTPHHTNGKTLRFDRFNLYQPPYEEHKKFPLQIPKFHLAVPVYFDSERKAPCVSKCGVRQRLRRDNIFGIFRLKKALDEGGFLD